MNKIVLTDAGIAELINAEQTGTAPVALVQVGLGTGKYDASATQTALSAEFKRLSTISGGDAGDNVIHLFVTDASSDAYTAFEVGIYTDSGTLLGVVSSRTEPIVQKAAGSTALLAIDFVLTNADPDSITVGDTTFIMPPATTEMQGIVELATPAEVVAGTDNYRAITPYALAQRTATAIRKGLMRFATVAESETGTNTDSAVTPAGLMAVAAKYLPLAGGTMTGRITSTNASVPIAFEGIGSGSYRDIQAKRSDTNKRLGVLRFNTTSTTNAVTIGASDAMDSAPSGVTVTRTLGDGNTAGTVTVTVATTPATTAKDKQVATTEYVKNCVPKSIGSATKLTYTNGDGILTASASSAGSASKPIYLNAGELTECSSSLTDYLPLAGGYMDNGAQIYLTENTFSLDNTYTTDKEATGLVYRLKQTKDDNTAATYKGGMLALHAAQRANSRNLQVGWRIANPRSGNNPSAGTDDGVTINTSNCWSKIGLRYYFDINRAYAFSSETPPLKGASTKYYSQYQLVTHGNLEHFLTRDGDANYPLSGTIPSIVGDIVKRTVDTQWSRINGGTSYADGANLLLYGINSSSNAGLFQLQARASASTSWQLKGDNTGLLSWNGSILNTGGVIVNQKNHFRIKDTDYAYNEVPSSDSHLAFGRVDKNNANVGRLQISRYATTGNQQVHLVVNSPVDGSEKVFLRGIQDSSGNHWVEISETRTTGTSNKEPVTVGYLNSRLGSYLPLAGGTMSGQIKTSYTDAIVKTNDTGHLTIIGGTAYANGASIKLSGKSETNEQGWFQVRAQDGTNSKDLIGKPDGTLTWDSSDVYVENRTNVSTIGPAITRSGTSNWLRFTGGETDYTDGASLILYGKTHSSNAGNFNLSAFDGTNRRSLSGDVSTGVLSWNGSVYLPNDGVYGTDLTSKTIDLNNCYSSISGSIKLFHCNSDSGSSNISHCPENKSFLLVSFTPRSLSTSDYVIHQHFYCIGAHYSRRCTNGTWTDWVLAIGASSASLGNANTPVYLSNGVITSTGKSFANYLPLAGGTMTGTIVVPRAAFKLYSDTDEMVIYGSSDADVKAPCITLRGDSRSSEPGSFYIRAGDGTNTKVLLGKPDGTLTWNGSRIAYGTAGDANTPVYVNSSGVVTSTGKSFADYLPLAGGAMTGSAIYRNVSNNYLAIYGGASNSDPKTGAYISLSGKDRADYGGTFRLSCTNGTRQQLLVGAIDSLTWNGAVPAASDDSTKIATTAYVKDCVPKSVGSGTKPVYTDSNGVVTASGSTVGSANEPVYMKSGTVTKCTMNSSSAAGLTRITNQAFGVYGSNGQSDANNNTQGFHHGYIKFASGLIIQWGSVYCTTAGVDVTFETPFVNKPQMTMSYNTGGDHMKGYNSITNTGFHAWVNTDSSAAQMKWMAIGI